MKKLIDWLSKIFKDKSETIAEDIQVPCCSERVHIAFRGLSDDRMYIAYSRTWSEIRYYKQNGLKVFCSVCRRRLL